MFLDVHGTVDRSHDVIVGIGASPTARSFRLAERFANVADDETGFTANGQATMTLWASARCAHALQFEIAHELRTVGADPDRRAALLRSFVRVFGDS